MLRFECPVDEMVPRAAITEDTGNRKCGYEAGNVHRTSIKMKMATTVIIRIMRGVERKIPKVRHGALYYDL